MTSPHLVSIRERIVIDGEPIAADRFVENWDDITPILEMTDRELTEKGEQPLTFFEALTVLALACFAEAPVDVAVIEVGMGEWDSTNVVQSQVQVITPGGDRPRQAARVDRRRDRPRTTVRHHQAVVVGRLQCPDAPRPSRSSSGPRSSPSRRSRSRAPGSPSCPTPRRSAGSSSPCRASPGATTTCSCRSSASTRPTTPPSRSPRSSRSSAAVAGPSTRTSCPRFRGRPHQPRTLQPIAQEPTVVVDAAHNPHGARALAEALPVAFPSEHVVGVVGILGDKDAPAFVRALKDTVKTFVRHAAAGDRALDADAFARIVVAEVGEDRVASSPRSSRHCRKPRPGGRGGRRGRPRAGGRRLHRDGGRGHGAGARGGLRSGGGAAE